MVLYGFLPKCQFVVSKFAEIIKFTNQLPNTYKTAFLLVFSAVCWTIWKYRNELCFKKCKKETIRQIILLIISLVHYWTCKVKKQVTKFTALWMPVELDVLPLASWHLDDVAAADPNEQEAPGTQLVLYEAQE